MEITKREVLVSVSIIALMLIIGLLINAKISEKIMDSNSKYNKALKIESQDLFEYGMRTNVGNAFVYGELEILDPVTYDEIGGQYSYVEKVKEQYTQHTRQVSYTDANGKTKTKTETYWTWDVVSRESKKSKKCLFLNNEFDYSKFDGLYDSYIDTLNGGFHVRYKYYGAPIKATGTIFASLKDGDIGDKVLFRKDMNAKEAYEDALKGNSPQIIFWIIWIAFTGAITYGFYYLDNDWLH